MRQGLQDLLSAINQMSSSPSTMGVLGPVFHPTPHNEFGVLLALVVGAEHVDIDVNDDGHRQLEKLPRSYFDVGAERFPVGSPVGEALHLEPGVQVADGVTLAFLLRSQGPGGISAQLHL
jgi:hypothetical protein